MNIVILIVFFLRYIKKDNYLCLKTNLAIFTWFLEKWNHFKVWGSFNQSFWGASHGAYYIFTQNYVEAKLLELLLWNFAWINGRSCAFRQNQSGYPNVNTFGTIKVLLVAVAFESRVKAPFSIFNIYFWLIFMTVNHLDENKYFEYFAFRSFR